MSEFACRQEGRILCRKHFTIERRDSRYPCKAHEEVTSGDQCDECSRKAVYRIVRFVNGKWQDYDYD